MKDKRIKSFLEDRLKRLESIKNEREWTTAELGDIACCKQTLAFIDTLGVKEVDLENEIKEEYLRKRVYGGRHNMLVILNEPKFTSIAKHFFELGMQVSNKAQKGEEV